MKIYIPYIFLALSGIAFLFAFLPDLIPSDKRQSIQGKQLQNIQQNLNREIWQLENENNQLIQSIKSSGFQSFNSANKVYQYPHFIFDRGNLIKWSDYRFVPFYAAIQGAYQFKFFRFTKGEYIILKNIFRHQNKGYELYSCLELSQKYKVANAYLKSGYNSEIIPYAQIKLSQNKINKSNNIYTTSGEFLFGIQFSESEDNTQNEGFIPASLILFLSFILLGIFLKMQSDRLEKNGHYGLALFLWFFYLLVLRALMLYFSFPYTVIESDLFNPKLYASSPISPSVGDLILNLLFFGILLQYLLRRYRKYKIYKKLIDATPSLRYLISAFIVLISYLVLFAAFYLLSTIFLHSKLNLDISKDIDFSFLSLIGILIFVFVSILYFFTLHILVRVFIQLMRKDKMSAALTIFLFGTLLYNLSAYFSQALYPFIIALNAFYFLVIFWLKFPKYLFRFSYYASIYLFAGALCCAALGTYTIYTFGQAKTLNDKRKFAVRLLPENDNYAQFLLTEAIQNIKKDTFILNFFDKPGASLDKVQEKIRKVYLSSYFDKYLVQVLLFDAQGENLLVNQQKAEGNYTIYMQRYKKIYYETDQEDIFFVNQPGVNLIKQYVCFLKIEKQGNHVGSIVLDLKQKRAAPSNVYPELLVEKKFSPSPESKNYSYAIYDDKQLIYSIGVYNYEKNFSTRLFQSNELYEKGLPYYQYQHLAVEGGYKKRVVVSSKNYTGSDIFSNFAFLFLLLIICIVSFIILYSLSQRLQLLKVNFATRIQFYLNIAFFLPLFTVSITTLSIISSDYRRDLNNTFIKKTEGVAVNLLNYLENYQNNKTSKEQFAKELTQLAQYAEVDVNVFDTKGYLILSSQPEIYESSEILSKYINPAALYAISEQENKKVMLNESVGNLKFQSVYVPIKSYESGKLLGILSVPFFDSKYELNKKMVGVLSTIINIFASIFIIFVLLSYFASQILTIPLRLITQKLRKTTFSHYNEPLDWNSKDEIGLFVEEYNKMLLKLDRSKEALARSQKESAWREMAKQVAHEIKNPLTPMKLTLQHMQVRLNYQSDKVRSLFERSFETLLSQIETLSDIATSFSSFAQMPIPESERFEISSVLQESRELYDNEDIHLEVDIAAGKYYVRGDKKLMGRIFTNLIKNAIESVTDGKIPEITIRLKSEIEGLITIEIHDNGEGVPEEIREKIFMPNFSTKSTGSGIGLAVARRGIEHAGGRIWFETEVKAGTSFFIELPLIE